MKITKMRYSAVGFAQLCLCLLASTESSQDNSTAPTMEPTGSAAPTVRCGEWRHAQFAELYFDDDIASIRFDVEIHDDISFDGMQLILQGTSEQPYNIWWRDSTWNEVGNWTRLASGMVVAKGISAYTDRIPFDEPLEVSFGSGIIAFRVDTPTSTNSFFDRRAPIVHPAAFVEGGSAAFTVMYGMSSTQATANAAPLYRGSFDAFMGALTFCHTGTRVPVTFAPTDSVAPTAMPSQSSEPPTAAPSSSASPTLSCGFWRHTEFATSYCGIDVQSFRFDIQVHQAIQINGLKLVLPDTSIQPYTIWWRNSTWEEPGSWMQVASGSVRGRGEMEFTDSVPFDSPLEVSQRNDVIALRIDTASDDTDIFANGAIEHPDENVECPGCYFTVFYGASSEEATDDAQPFFSSSRSAFIGEIEFCNLESPFVSSSPSDSPSSTPSGAPSSTPTTMPSRAPSVMPTAVPTSIPSRLPSPTPSHQPTSAPSSSPTSLASSAPSDKPSNPPTDAPSNTEQTDRSIGGSGTSAPTPTSSATAILAPPSTWFGLSSLASTCASVAFLLQAGIALLL